MGTCWGETYSGLYRLIVEGQPWLTPHRKSYQAGEK
jgi:hypothetical protein